MVAPSCQGQGEAMDNEGWQVKDDGANNVIEYVESILGCPCQGNPSYYSRKPLSKPSKTLFIKHTAYSKYVQKVLKNKG